MNWWKARAMQMSEPLKQISDRLAGQVAYYEAIDGEGSESHMVALERLAFDNLRRGAGYEGVCG